MPAAFILAIAAGVTAFNQLLSTGAMGLGKPGFVLAAESVGLSATAFFLWLLLARYQLIGAACASLCSYLVVSFVLLALIGRQTKLGLGKLLLPDRADAVLIASKLRALRVAY